MSSSTSPELAPSTKRSADDATKSSDQAASPSPSAKKQRRSASPAHNDEFDDHDDAGLDDAQLLAAVQAAESAAEAASSQPTASTSSAPAIPSSPATRSSTSATRSSTTSTPKQTLLFGAKPPSQPSHPTIVPPSDPSDLLYVERQTMGPEWFRHLEAELSKDYFTKLKQFLQAEEKAGRKTFPPPHLVHSWSRLTPLDSVKVVVVGQDPYHGPGQACGLSFSVPRGVAAPPSLKNIYKEIQNEFPGFKPPNHGCLEEWARQGVLLLNACLTVSAGNAGSHHGRGWENLTKVVLKTIADNAARGAGRAGADAVANSKIATMFAKASKKHNQPAPAEKNEDKPAAEEEGKAKEGKQSNGDHACKGVVFMVWGQPAAKTLAEAGITDKSPNVLILRSPHPSPLSAHRGFLGNGHFAKANKWLEARYGASGGIDWTRL
ncbi:uncharacterized protein PFL1_03917 [Pseudozyma flocculosa PF-1]|uniref:Uracil-DNA glycosylase n=2 Tax=Pseudozyma flocculosa TaxID=84751 RepID=A0A5C3EY41_9BASI|nr:uncharacterized protein PFL1_03917 [Pseudozyma flocculosa PF-1]EPQ28614.1 hypothetical protein PFL1_03917 [Pseudozyma flocculosa PF-1]SPO36556.1 related to UNG1 - Uracil-DNA glycosylase [Pseudozyma flocculosa]